MFCLILLICSHAATYFRQLILQYQLIYFIIHEHIAKHLVFYGQSKSGEDTFEKPLMDRVPVFTGEGPRSIGEGPRARTCTTNMTNHDDISS